MDIKQEKYDVGVMVARFQVPYLTEAHHELIRYVKKHFKVIILLGVPPTLGTRNNPLDFEMRKQMILSAYPEINVLLINDCVDNTAWSKNVDQIVSSITTPNQKVVLYGGRDSFIGCYSGRYPTLELESELKCSGTEIRKEASLTCINSPEFRAGVVWACHNTYPKVYTTVDMAILKNNLEKGSIELLLGKKPHEKLYRFVGGFSEPNSESFEMDAIREVAEETGLEVSKPNYVGSFKVEDWRYRKEVDKVKTLFFVCFYIFGKAEARDDIEALKWFDLSEIKVEQIVVEHRTLFASLLKYLNSNLTVNWKG